MNFLGNTRRKLGAWVACNQKAALLILTLFISYGYFHFGLDAGSWIVIAWRIVTLLLIVFILLSPFEPVKTVIIESDESDQPKTDMRSDQGKGINSSRGLSDEYYLKDRLDTKKDYNLFVSKILSIIKKTFAAHTTVMYLLDKQTNTLQLKCVVSEEESILKDTYYMPDEQIFGKIFNNDSSFFSNDPEEVNALVPYYPEPGRISSVIAVPVYIKDEICGVIIIDSLEHNVYSEDDIPLVETYSGIIAETIINYNNLFEFEYSAQLFSFFYEVSRGLISNLKFEEILDLLVTGMKDIIHYDHLAISSYEAGSDYAKIIRVEGNVDDFPVETTFPLEEGLNGWVIRKRKSILIPDLEKNDQFIPRYTTKEKTNYNLRSFLGAPICCHDISFGAITVESFTPNRYDERDEKILVMLANNFGVALERSRTLKQLELQATTDGLTNLHNYRSFMQRISEETERTLRYNSHFTLLMIDIDRFKQVNDSYGHLAGDKVLTRIASSLRKSTRNVDFICRYGGEEFTVILVETALQKALLTAERIRENIANLNTQYNNNSIDVTVSVGAVEFPNSSKDAESLIDEADKALYRAKSKGRNCVVAYTEKAESII